VFSDLRRLQPNAAIRLLLDEASYEVESLPRRGFAANRGYHAKVGETAIRQLLERTEIGIVLGNQYGVVKHVMQPCPHRFEAPEIEAPVALIKLVRREYKMKSQRVSMQQMAM
jgi:hypothetical protein